MIDPFVLGASLFGLLIAPLLAYALWRLFGRRPGGSGERTIPSSTTHNAPSRRIPGGKGPGGD